MCIFSLLWVWYLLVVSSVICWKTGFFCEYETKLHWKVYILFTVHVVFVGRLVCSVNMLYMELSYTGSLDRSTRASGHVTVQISALYACKTMAGYHCFYYIFEVYLIKLHCVYSLYCAVVFVGILFTVVLVVCHSVSRLVSITFLFVTL